MPREINDLTGKRFGRLIVISRAKNSASGKPMWNCLCDCGAEKVIGGSALMNGTKSCGCYRKEWAAAQQYRHGDTHNRLYNVWNMMKQRCGDKNNKHYNNYGGRGISVCKEWRADYIAFRDWAFANGYDPKAPKGKCTIDRIDNNGNYCPENCRWVSTKEQARNTRRNRIIELNGKRQTLAEWAEETGIYYLTIHNRLKSGWRVEDALTIKPIIGRNQTWREAN